MYIFIQIYETQKSSGNNKYILQLIWSFLSAFRDAFVDAINQSSVEFWNLGNLANSSSATSFLMFLKVLSILNEILNWTSCWNQPVD